MILHHTLDIYDAELHLVTNQRDWSTLRRKLKHLDPKPEAGGLATFATFHPDDGSLPIPTLVLWVDLKQHKSHADLVDTLAHEASHAAGQLLEHIGHDTRGTDEPSAYLVGWLVRWMWDALADQVAA